MKIKLIDFGLEKDHYPSDLMKTMPAPMCICLMTAH